MKRTVLLLLLSVAMSVGSFAIPARKMWKTYTLADGSTIVATLVGDESYHYYLSEDGKPYVMSGDVLRPVGETVDSVNQVWAKRRVALNSRRVKRRAGANRAAYIGSKKGLIILVDFPNKQFNSSLGNPKQRYEDLANKVGYSDNDHIGSIHDYFLAQSYGKFDLTFDVVGPIRMKRNYSYYGSNYPSDDAKAVEMIKEACRGAADSVDFKDYDWNGDGEVDQVYVVYAGEGEATGGDASTVWPHEYELGYTGDDISLQGMTISTYACGNELMEILTGTGWHARKKIVNMGAGLIAHEFSHCLGLMDMYDTNSNGSFSGTKSWDLMSSGSYNGPKGVGEVPPSFNAYERNFAGWLDFTELAAKNVNVKSMESISKAPVAYRITNPGYQDEYFTLEYRDITGWDQYVAGGSANSGILIFHVDYDSEAWEYNAINNSQYYYHEHLGVFSASDGNNSAAEEYLDVFRPGAEITWNDGNQGFELFHSYNGTTELPASITNITVAADGTMGFDFTPDGNTTAIRNITALGNNTKVTAEYFSLDGIKLSKPQKGVNIVKYSDGTTKKVVFISQ